MNTEVEREILEVMAEEAGVEPHEINLSTGLYDLGIDSLSSLEILVTLEDRFDVIIPEESLKNTSSVREIVNAFLQELKNREEGES